MYLSGGDGAGIHLRRDLHDHRLFERYEGGVEVMNKVHAVDVIDALDELRFAFGALYCIDIAKDAGVNEDVLKNAEFFVRRSMERLIKEMQGTLQASIEKARKQ